MEKHLNHIQKQNEEDTMNSLTAEMVLDHALRMFQKQQLQKEIDHALLNRNKQEFLKLSQQLQAYL
ncbi:MULTISPECIES: IDEAL domain-containing protein [Bacillaceae]|uniref:IDEAL domain-containing protein n=1 Tax=Bacillaceae TaxID=186817 RepID=UPI00211B5C83|nr:MULTISPECIES: IDEAL domain-containing protein [Bacillaceae]MDT2047984.1 IDEAL domain-containing protein [Priestia flexa]USY55930.1 IDEAL domain-containing protein [Bacillus sp. 1780r2a1]